MEASRNHDHIFKLLTFVLVKHVVVRIEDSNELEVITTNISDTDTNFVLPVAKLYSVKPTQLRTSMLTGNMNILTKCIGKPETFIRAISYFPSK